MGLQKLLIDTNVVLDFMLARKPFDTAAYGIFELAAKEKAELFISINSFCDIIYFVSKEYDTEYVRDKMTELLDFVRVIEAGHKDALKCLRMIDFNDIEDAFQMQSALKEGVEYIITRDLKGFEKSLIPALPPDNYLDILNKQSI